VRWRLKKTWENIGKSLGKYGQMVYEWIFCGFLGDSTGFTMKNGD